MKRNRGLTLIEYLIVLSIIGIILAVAIPNYLKWTSPPKDLNPGCMMTDIRSIGPCDQHGLCGVRYGLRYEEENFGREYYPVMYKPVKICKDE